MNKPDHQKLLSQDIEKRFQSEKQFVHDPDHRGNRRNRTMQLIIGLLMAIVSIGGIVFGLLALL